MSGRQDITPTDDLEALSSAPVLSIGYGRRTIEQVVGLLAACGVQFVADVRSTPWSKFKPEFSQTHLAEALRASGIRYVFMGAELGGRPEDPDCYDEDGRVDYIACARRLEFSRGIDRLVTASRTGHRVAMLCSEGRPEDCHRTKLVGRALLEVGVEVQHLDEHGALRSQDEILDRLRGSQMTLIDEETSMLKSRGRYRVASL